MIKLIGPSTIFFLFVCVSCGGGSTRKVHFGQTTEASLRELEGEPVKVEKLSVTDGNMLIYDDEKKYQVVEGVVTNSFMNPTAEERSLVFWKHRFKSCRTTDQPVKGNRESRERVFACEAQGLSVIYARGTGLVSRVVEHAKE